ncbi:MAG: UbiA family prenyltransferase [Cyanobacteria bacterium]|nr:UbiA family prenyltransferase [Cyanobacteriota bacterium]
MGNLLTSVRLLLSAMNNNQTTTPRWFQYQEERFPILKYAILVAAFTTSGLSLSYLLTGGSHPLTFQMFASAFAVTFLTFFQLRVADEHKDAEHDQRYHPERPVPRGLVTLGELRRVAFDSAVIQFLVAAALSPMLLVPLLATWFYLFLMTKEFFVGEWLRKRPVLYMVSHMSILFFTDFFITSCHWMVTEKLPPFALVYFLATSFFLGIVIEVGRKIRSPKEETEAMDTYTSLWGTPTAIKVWVGALALSACFAGITAAHIHSLAVSITMLVVMFAFCILGGKTFLAKLTPTSAKRIDRLSGLWTLTSYASIGFVPLALKMLIN